jgi:hypothetical protein
VSKNQRKIANFFRVSTLSKNYLLYFVVGGVAFLGIMLIYASRLLSDVNVALSTLPDANLAISMQDRVFIAVILIFISFLAYLVFTVSFITVMSHRVGGPIVAICNYIRELQKGNYSERRALRKGDELKPIMDELQSLASVLEKSTLK